jgi:hypothetical protein
LKSNYAGKEINMSKMSALKQEVREIREDGKPRIDSVKESNVGICATCKNSPSCLYLKNAKEAVYHCEEFDNFEPAREMKTSIKTATVEPAAQLSNLKGLCLNCAKSGACSFTKPESGVWHCDEYE